MGRHLRKSLSWRLSTHMSHPIPSTTKTLKLSFQSLRSGPLSPKENKIFSFFFASPTRGSQGILHPLQVTCHTSPHSQPIRCYHSNKGQNSANQTLNASDTKDFATVRNTPLSLARPLERDSLCNPPISSSPKLNPHA
jgi:hypothetical protein